MLHRNNRVVTRPSVSQLCMNKRAKSGPPSTVAREKRRPPQVKNVAAKLLKYMYVHKAESNRYEHNQLLEHSTSQVGQIIDFHCMI